MYLEKIHEGPLAETHVNAVLVGDEIDTVRAAVLEHAYAMSHDDEIQNFQAAMRELVEPRGENENSRQVILPRENSSMMTILNKFWQRTNLVVKDIPSVTNQPPHENMHMIARLDLAHRAFKLERDFREELGELIVSETFESGFETLERSLQDISEQSA